MKASKTEKMTAVGRKVVTTTRVTGLCDGDYPIEPGTVGTVMWYDGNIRVRVQFPNFSQPVLVKITELRPAKPSDF